MSTRENLCSLKFCDYFIDCFTAMEGIVSDVVLTYNILNKVWNSSYCSGRES